MTDLKGLVLKKIQETTDPDIIAEVYRLLESDFDDQEVYKLSDEQKSAVAEAQDQIGRGDFLTNEQASKETEEWLKRK